MEVFSLKFVDDEEHFKFGNAGKGRHKSKWTWLVSTEENNEFDGGDDCHFESDLSETEAAGTSSDSDNSSCFEEEEDDVSDFEESEAPKHKKAQSSTRAKQRTRKSDRQVPPKSAISKARNRTSQQQKPKSRGSKKSKALTQEEIEELCFEVGERKEDLRRYVEEKLKDTGDINFFASRALVRDFLLSEATKLQELLDDMIETFLATVRNVFFEKGAKSEKKARLSHCWTQQLTTFLRTAVWLNVCEDYGSSVLRGDQISILSCIAEAVYDFVHIHEQEKTLHEVVMESTKEQVEDKVILHRLAGAALYRMMKVRRNTVEGKKGSMKVTDSTKGILEDELHLLNRMKRQDMSALPRELNVHLNEGGLYFIRDEFIEFVEEVDNHTRKFASERVLRKNPHSFLTTVFSYVYGNTQLFESFSSALKAVGIKESVREAAKAVFRGFVVKLCRTRVKVFMESMREKDLEKQNKVCDADTNLRDKLKGFALSSKRQ